MSWFEAFRNNYGFTSYPDFRTSVTLDKPVVIVTYCCALFGLATLIATLGIKGRERWSFVLRASYAVAIGSIIIACLAGHGWQTGSVRIQTGYVYRNSRPFVGYLGMAVALDGGNITLDGYYEGRSGPGHVFYSERISWPHFGSRSEVYSYFLERGLPDPILKVLAFLTIDEGGLTWSRSFHKSGYFSMVLLCTSLAFWIVTNILLCSAVIYGAYLFLITGVTMFLASITYHVCQLPVSLAISFNDSKLQLAYGWSFWLNLMAGCVTFLLGLGLVIADHFDHDSVANFFHLEKLVKEDLPPYENTHQSEEQVEAAAAGASGLSQSKSSIFKNVYKQPMARGNSRRNGLLPGQSAFIIRSTDGNDGHSKVNPIYCISKEMNSVHQNVDADECQPECLCEETEMFVGDQEISCSEIQEDSTVRTFSSSDALDNKNNNNNEKHNREVRFHNNIFAIDITDQELKEDSDSIYGNTWASKRSYGAPNDDSPVNSLNGYMVSDDSDDGNHPVVPRRTQPRSSESYNTESTVKNDDPLDSGIDVAHRVENRRNRMRRNSVFHNGLNPSVLINIDDS